MYIIAEMACSHEGEPSYAKEIIHGAIEADADAIQFQIWKLDEMVVPHHDNYEVLSSIEMTYAQWEELAQDARAAGSIDIIACVYERESINFAEGINVDAYKVHSSDVSNPYLLERVARTGKRVDLSVGGSTLDEIQDAVDTIRRTSNSEIWLMYGYQDFPTRPDDVHLDYMVKLKELFELPTGYQDHSAGGTPEGFWLPAAAIGAGVDILEKHITHDRSYEGIDHEAALNPDEFAEFVRMTHQVEAARGISVPRNFSEEEEAYRSNSKKSIVAAQNLPKGTRITRSNVTFRRANELGLFPNEFSKIEGKTLRQGVSRFQRIKDTDVS